MRTICAGSRNFTNYEVVKKALDTHEITEIISGGCRGVDQLGERYAKEHNLPIKIFNPNWGELKLAAGPIRNKKMLEYADGGKLILFWNGVSRGSADIKRQSKNYDIEVEEHIIYVEMPKVQRQNASCKP